MINLQKKALKLLLEIQNDLKTFYSSNDPESVMAIDSINTEEELEEMEENLKDRDYRIHFLNPILFIYLFICSWRVKSFKKIIVLNASIFRRNCWR